MQETIELTLPERLEIQTSGPSRARVRPPGSKSLTNRALPCAALARGTSLLRGALESDDTHVMIEALTQLGVKIACDPAAKTIKVVGCGGPVPARHAELFVGNSGTSIRFLTAMLAAGQGTYRLDGTPRMRERPIGDLIEALGQLGAKVECELNNGCPPVVVHAAGLSGGRATIRGDVSSQFLSGLLMAAPYARGTVELALAGELVSQPYVEMTLAVMAAFGVEVAADGFSELSILPSRGYLGCDYSIEPDASAASYFFAAAAITGGEITVDGLTESSLQGDVDFVDVLRRMGCEVDYGANSIRVFGGKLKGVEVDMNEISDTVQTLGAVALFADGPTTITNVGHIRHKETDRIAALATELRKLGATVEERSDGLRITPGALHGAEIDTYDDHRMAMSLALAGLRVPGVVIKDPACVNKTYPEFFQDLASIRTGLS
jgi:3-phosphoshikimate 1-carboxyvinyltransferase